MTVLLLGGTSEARELAVLLDGAGVGFVSSLAGRVERPRLPVGEVRIGGFGGVDGLRYWLVEHAVSAVVDATHPFAEGMSANAVAACRASGVPLLRLERPGWSGAPGADGWHWVDSHAEAADLAASLGRRPWLTVGRQPLAAFVGPLVGHRALVRVVDPPEIEVPEPWTVVLDRGPYDLAGELQVVAEEAVDVLVTKDSGGRYTWPKMAAAGRLGVPVVVVRRRAEVDGVETVPDATAAVRWVVQTTVVS
ncbi:precorrin-6A/cobalt-precorrin-6A reductase [Nocardioides cavernae]|uniref:Precorrin-6A/cobalt-precorrin-6A reductase n=1 Tax=Nocardioides cavernae TaxID=1921566 RepID=A0A7Y9KRK0_9ACTN|nr:cobalt-precorrin-6A reductase [Nocardioides cavernae]NYE36655.1 precorrin-6A/cobalt-precorrin-6A reductase [Nocardioides cavernae]